MHIPFAGRNTKYNASIGRPRLLVLNKMDLTKMTQAKNVVKELRERGEKEIIFTNCQKQHHTSVRKLMNSIIKITGKPESEDGFIKLMVVGIPNVGKSSLINALRRIYLKKGKAALVGKLPATTRSVQSSIKVSDDPKIYLLDTPGVLMPNLSSDEVILKLAAGGILLGQHIGEFDIADYILYMLNRWKLFRYVDMFNMAEPCDDIDTVMTAVAKKLNALQKGGVPDYMRAAKYFLVKFREGDLGKLSMDIAPKFKEE